MTTVEILYRYAAQPTEAVLFALSAAREVYGIRQLTFDRTAHTVRVEYDATRLSEAVVHQLLRRSGLEIVERVELAVVAAELSPQMPITRPP